MRVTRIITAVVAFALIGLAPLASSAAVPADTRTRATAPAQAPTTTAARGATTVGTKIVRRSGKLIMVGNVKPAKRYRVTIQKATTCNADKGTCNFKFYKKVRSNNKGHYSVRVYAPVKGSWAWRARVGKKSSDIWVTCKRRTATAPCPTP